MRFCPACCAAYRTSVTHCLRDQTELITGKDPLIGSVVAGRYRVQSQIGRGGMGQVYQAEHTEFGKTFALKILFGDLAANDKMLARFRREAQTASHLKHIHIISVVDFGTTDKGLAYLAMEMLSGRSLAQAIREEGPFSLRRAFHIGRQIAGALAHAHDKGVLHRDLKPENVFLEDREEGADFATVLDFGLARMLQPKVQENGKEEVLTKVGTVQGTPEFMSPEQAQGLTLGPPSDLYALGLLLYCMLSQELPFEIPEKRVEMLSLHAFEPPRPLSSLVAVPRAVNDLVMRLLAKQPDERLPNGREVCFAMDDALAEVERERPKHGSLVDTWDESSSDQVGLTISEATEFPRDDLSSTAPMSREELSSVLELYQAADSPGQESEPGYVVIEPAASPYRAAPTGDTPTPEYAEPAALAETPPPNETPSQEAPTHETPTHETPTPETPTPHDAAQLETTAASEGEPPTDPTIYQLGPPTPPPPLPAALEAQPPAPPSAREAAPPAEPVAPNATAPSTPPVPKTIDEALRSVLPEFDAAALIQTTPDPIPRESLSSANKLYQAEVLAQREPTRDIRVAKPPQAGAAPWLAAGAVAALLVLLLWLVFGF
jgi:serine/threonine protein kinase